MLLFYLNIACGVLALGSVVLWVDVFLYRKSAADARTRGVLARLAKYCTFATLILAAALLILELLLS